MTQKKTEAREGTLPSTETLMQKDIREIKSDFRTEENPLIQIEVGIPTRMARVRSEYKPKTLVDIETGEVEAAAVIHAIEEKDEEHFVKVFSAGITAAYSLTPTGQKVFQALLQEYEAMPLTGGFADCIYLAWMDNGLSGRDIDMSQRTFNRGLKELLAKHFIWPRKPNVYWINPALFFKGNRVMLINEYHKKRGLRNLEKAGEQKTDG